LSDLHPSIVALVSLAANIASNNPKQGLCQVDRLKAYGVAKSQIDAVIEIMRLGVLLTPGVIVDGKIVHSGGVPDRKKVESWLSA